MEFGSSSSLLLFLFFGLLSSAIACDRCVHQSKAAYVSSSAALSAGACGYRSLALGFYGGHVAAGSSALFRKGVGCGACFQIRCKNPAICSTSGVKVVLTDLNGSNQTDFVLSSTAFAAMAKPGMVPQLMRLGIADTEYKRIPCQYNQNLSIRVEENSQRENKYLAIKFLYQGGQTDMVGVDIAQFPGGNWRSIVARDYGAVWGISNVPAGPLQFRMIVTGGYDGKWVWANRAVLPADWKNGVVYDTGVQITDIAQESCYPCDTSEWK